MAKKPATRYANHSVLWSASALVVGLIIPTASARLVNTTPACLHFPRNHLTGNIDRHHNGVRRHIAPGTTCIHIVGGVTVGSNPPNVPSVGTARTQTGTSGGRLTRGALSFAATA